MPMLACPARSYLVLQHIGPEDASLPPLKLSVGAPNASSGTHILLAQATYCQIWQIISQQHMTQQDLDPHNRLATSSVAPAVFGTFEVLVYGEQASNRLASSGSYIGPQTFLAIVQQARQALPVGSSLPESIEKIARMVRAS